MKVPPSELSAKAQHLLDALRQRGYTVVEERYDEESFGNALFRLEGHGTHVRLARERALWFVELGGASDDEKFPPVTWHSFLTAAMHPVDIPPFDEQADLLLIDLPEIETLLDDFDDHTLKELEEWELRRG